LGQSVTLPNDTTPGSVIQADYVAVHSLQSDLGAWASG
jgi:hypothetical protein